MQFVKLLVAIVGLRGSLLATQEYVVPLLMLANINHPINHIDRQNYLNQQNQIINFLQDIKKEEKQRHKDQKYITNQKKESEQRKMKNIYYNNKHAKYVGKYNGRLH